MEQSNVYEWQALLDRSDPWLVEYMSGMTLEEALAYQEKFENQYIGLKRIANPNVLQSYEHTRKAINAKVSLLAYFAARKNAEKSEKEKGVVIA
jgi:hypothetical protein